ncbi:uncharacterized protein PSFLO_03643 [Pseudozyma flocculosa]|uniref:Uncharacterized protein n=1 Tax=Pseudozyma flocculosa TaxID=84751 RepID=A0A5C3F2P8_9BASI|nr:uncharacterized protein PSFLO_03643 [Pseudozyma flocculosa]
MAYPPSASYRTSRSVILTAKALPWSLNLIAAPGACPIIADTLRCDSRVRRRSSKQASLGVAAVVGAVPLDAARQKRPCLRQGAAKAGACLVQSAPSFSAALRAGRRKAGRHRIRRTLMPAERSPSHGLESAGMAHRARNPTPAGSIPTMIGPPVACHQEPGGGDVVSRNTPIR